MALFYSSFAVTILILLYLIIRLRLGRRSLAEAIELETQPSNPLNERWKKPSNQQGGGEEPQLDKEPQRYKEPQLDKEPQRNKEPQRDGEPQRDREPHKEQEPQPTKEEPSLDLEIQPLENNRHQCRGSNNRTRGNPIGT